MPHYHHCTCPVCRQRQLFDQICQEHAPASVVSTTNFSMVAAVGNVGEEGEEEVQARADSMIAMCKQIGLKTKLYPSPFTKNLLMCVLIDINQDARGMGNSIH